VISNIIFGFRSLAKTVPTLWGRLYRVLGKAKFSKIMLNFLTEAAVLVAVFPILDVIIDSMKPGGLQVTWHLVIWSEGIAGGLLFFACIMSGLGES
jgi:hypothetical protein